MLSTLLNNVVSYFSKHFFLASFLPMLTFLSANGVMAYVLVQPYHDWIETEILGSSSTGQFAFVSTGGFVVALVAAYVLSALSNALRRVLEGKWPDWVAQLFVPLEAARLQRLQTRFGEAVETQGVLEKEWGDWKTALIEAREKGPKGVAFTCDGSIPEQIRKLQRLRARNELIKADAIRETVSKLKAALLAHDVEKSPELRQYHKKVWELSMFALEQARGEHVRLLNERYSSFGTFITPTRMGNVANSIQEYAARRYSCNLAAIWSKLQRCIEKDDKAHAALQDSKAQLDFLVACAWLTWAWTLMWGVTLALWSPVASWFVGTVLGGSILGFLWYRAATEQYRAFGDVMMTSLDMFRFDLLQSMRIALPTDAADERDVWRMIDALASRPEGQEPNLRYRHPTT